MKLIVEYWGHGGWQMYAEAPDMKAGLQMLDQVLAKTKRLILVVERREEEGQ
jgi:hypothetical protein